MDLMKDIIQYETVRIFISNYTRDKYFSEYALK